MEPIVIISIVLFIIFLIVIIKFNIIVSLRNKVKQSRSSIDVYLTQRFDLIPNLVETVKAYNKHEQETFTKIAELRASYANTKNLKVGEELTNKMNTIMLLSESNPDLKSSDQFLVLQNSLARIESQLQAARRIYNGDVTLYNTTIETFPNSLVAAVFGFKKEELFTIDEYKRENVKIDV